MTIKEITKETIAVVGLGSENFALLNFLFTKKIIFPITIFAFQGRQEIERHYPELEKWNHITWVISKPSFIRLKKFSLILKSPGAFFSPELRKQLKESEVKVLAPMQLFLDFCPSKNIIGVTGTKGKGTTSSIIAAILKKDGKKVWLGGNIGVAPFSFIQKIKSTDWVILELSSFQLEDMTSSPHISIFTNFTPEHLSAADKNNPNYHPSLTRYWRAKLNIVRHQTENDYAVINGCLEDEIKNAKLKSEVIFFTTSTLSSNLPGDHNKENIAAAETVAELLNIPKAVVAAAVKSFKGLPYRLEKVADKQGILYYNDSFATTPSATITALKAFDQPVILIAGGADKGSNFKQLGRVIKQQNVKAVILFKGTALKKLILTLYKKSAIINIASSMPLAVKKAQKLAEKGDVILLSPACASFGLFKNYKDRGEQFNRIVKI